MTDNQTNTELLTTTNVSSSQADDEALEKEAAELHKLYSAVCLELAGKGSASRYLSKVEKLYKASRKHLARIKELEDALKALEREGCFCDVRNGGPLATVHSKGCNLARAALNKDNKDV